MNFKYFQIQKWMLQTVEEVEEKDGVICVVFIFPSRVMILKLSKKLHFFNFVLTQEKNLSILKQVTHIHLKGLVTCFQKMVVSYAGLMFWRYWCLNLKNFVKFLLSSICFDTLIPNILWTVAQTPIKHIIFWKTVIRTSNSIYVNYLTGLCTLHFFGQFKDHNSGWKHGN